MTDNKTPQLMILSYKDFRIVGITGNLKEGLIGTQRIMRARGAEAEIREDEGIYSLEGCYFNPFLGINIIENDGLSLLIAESLDFQELPKVLSSIVKDIKLETSQDYHKNVALELQDHLEESVEQYERLIAFTRESRLSLNDVFALNHYVRFLSKYKKGINPFKTAMNKLNIKTGRR